MFVKKVLMIVLVSVIYLINLNIPVAAEENEQDIIFSPMHKRWLHCRF